MVSDLLKTRPHSLTPYDRMLWQQRNCIEDITGYAVGLATTETKRAAYMTGDGTEITNDERQAAVLPKTEAVALMNHFRDSGHWFSKRQYSIAFLVPVSGDLPLNMCTFQGY